MRSALYSSYSAAPLSFSILSLPPHQQCVICYIPMLANHTQYLGIASQTSCLPPSFPDLKSSLVIKFSAVSALLWTTSTTSGKPASGSRLHHVRLEKVSTYFCGSIMLRLVTSLACLVWVVLVAVVCDCPAASKVGGFPSHSHQLFCPQDKAQRKDLPTLKCFKKDGLDFHCPLWVPIITNY